MTICGIKSEIFELRNFTFRRWTYEKKNQKGVQTFFQIEYQDFKLGQNWVKFWLELGQILVGFSGGKIYHVDLARF